MNVFVFPGQGSQKRGMGQELFDEVNEFAAVEQQVDALLGYSVRELCLTDPANRLNQTQYTQPALYVVNALHYYKALAEGASPQAVAGHSLGEYNALLAAGAFDFLTGLSLVKKRGELMAQARNGAMAAVIDLEPDRIASVLRDAGLSGIDVANYNSPAQTVISGPAHDLKLAEPPLKAAGARAAMLLPVSAAFHSRYMLAAAQEFDDFLHGVRFNPLRLPVIANVTGQPYPVDNPAAVIRSMLVKQIYQPVQWMQSVSYLLHEGATEFVEIGPGTVLTKLIQKIQETARPYITGQTPKVDERPANDAALVPAQTKEASESDEIFNIIVHCVQTVLPALEEHTFRRNDRLVDLGANSVDRAEIVMMVLEELDLGISRTEVFGPRNIGELADLLYAKSSNR